MTIKGIRQAARYVASFLFGGAFLWLTVASIVRHFFHPPAPSIIGRFLDSGFRKKLQPPAAIMERSGIRKGMTVLEVGCGSGAYTTSAARAVGDGGHVTALDVQSAMLAQLRKKLNRPEDRDLQNVRLVQAGAHELPFGEGSFDLVYMVTVLPEVPDQQRALAEVRRVLKPGGILAVTEFFPDPDYPLPSATVRWGTGAGFQVEGVYGNLWTYTVRFQNAATPLL